MRNNRFSDLVVSVPSVPATFPGTLRTLSAVNVPISLYIGNGNGNADCQTRNAEGEGQRSHFLAPHKENPRGRGETAIGERRRAGETAGYLPRGKLDEACQRFGVAYETARKAAQVCKSFESGMRIPELTFNHHQLVANHPAAPALLEWAAENQAPATAATPAPAPPPGVLGPFWPGRGAPKHPQWGLVQHREIVK